MDYNLGLDQDLINTVKSIVEASCSEKKMEKEELHPNQKVLDKNKNGKLDADDFKKLRKEEKDPKEYGYEGEMVMTQLKTLCRHAEHLMGMLKPDTDLPEWVQSKITLATDYMQTSHDYLMSSMNESLDENSIADYYNKKRSMRDAEHKKQDPKTQASHYAKNMVDTEKAAKKAGERGIKIDARDFDYRVRNGVQRGKLPEEVELDEAEMSHSQLMKKIKDGTHEAMTDVKPGKHVEVRHTGTGKRSMVMVKHDSVKEDVEQIDELSKATLGSYVKKATTSRNKMYKDMPKNKTSGYPEKTMSKIMNRNDSIRTAQDKLTKEQVEEIEALAAKHGLTEE